MVGKLVGRIRVPNGKPGNNWVQCLAEELKAFGVEIPEWGGASRGASARYDGVVDGTQVLVGVWRKKVSAVLTMLQPLFAKHHPFAPSTGID